MRRCSPRTSSDPRVGSPASTAQPRGTSRTTHRKQYEANRETSSRHLDQERPVTPALATFTGSTSRRRTRSGRGNSTHPLGASRSSARSRRVRSLRDAATPTGNRVRTPRTWSSQTPSAAESGLDPRVENSLVAEVDTSSRRECRRLSSSCAGASSKSASTPRARCWCTGQLGAQLPALVPLRAGSTLTTCPFDSATPHQHRPQGGHDRHPSREHAQVKRSPHLRAPAWERFPPAGLVETEMVERKHDPRTAPRQPTRTAGQRAGTSANAPPGRRGDGRADPRSSSRPTSGARLGRPPCCAQPRRGR